MLTGQRRECAAPCADSVFDEDHRVDAGCGFHGNRKGMNVSVSAGFKTHRKHCVHKGKRHVIAVIMIMGEKSVKTIPFSCQRSILFFNGETSKAGIAEGAAVFAERR